MPLNRTLSTAALAALLVSCAPESQPQATVPVASPATEEVDGPRLPLANNRRVLQTLAENLDNDPAEEQIILLQNRTNLSLPVIIQVADYDQARKTYYLAWEGQALASASQPLSLVLSDLVGDHQKEVLIQGFDESGRSTLDALRLIPPSGGLGLAYRSVFSVVSRGIVRVEQTPRPASYDEGQNSDLSDTIIVEEPDATSERPETVRTTYTWLFQKGEYVATSVERFERTTATDSALETLFQSDNSALTGFLGGPWVRAVSDRSGLLLLFFDPSSREITFATNQAQEVYRWEITSRSSRGGLYVVGSNTLINLIKLQMSVAITATDTIEVAAQDNPGWSGTYKRLDPSAARVLARQGTASLTQQSPPVGLYRNDKGDEMDFQAPEVRFKLAGVAMTGSVAVYPLEGVTILQIKVPPRPGNPGFSKAYSMVYKEESGTSRVVRTLRLQGGTLMAKGWVSDQSDPLRLEQVEGTTSR